MTHYWFVCICSKRVQGSIKRVAFTKEILLHTWIVFKVPESGFLFFFFFFRVNSDTDQWRSANVNFFLSLPYEIEKQILALRMKWTKMEGIGGGSKRKI